MAMICRSGCRECDGCMSCQDEMPICPVCDNETDAYYFDKYNEIIGCDECVEKKDAWEVVAVNA